MDILTSHRAHLEETAERLIAEVESVFGIVRRPLAEQLSTHRAFLRVNIRAVPLEAAELYGLALAARGGELEAQSDAARDAAMDAVDALIVALEASEQAGLGRFVRQLTSAMGAGVTLRSTSPAGDASVALAADTAFHLYRYFTEILSRVLARFTPRSALALRC